MARLSLAVSKCSVRRCELRAPALEYLDVEHAIVVDAGSAGESTGTQAYLDSGTFLHNGTGAPRLRREVFRDEVGLSAGHTAIGFGVANQLAPTKHKKRLKVIRHLLDEAVECIRGL